jgi:glutaryl-CoA dehydrogenase
MVDQRGELAQEQVDLDHLASPRAVALAHQAKIADCALELYKGPRLALHLGRLKDSGQIQPAQVSLGKLTNVREALEIAGICRTVLGGSGVTLDYPVLRHANNLESVLTYEGTSEIHQLAIGRALTGLSAYT